MISSDLAHVPNPKLPFGGRKSKNLSLEGGLMGIFAHGDDEERAYRTYDDIVGRSIRRGADKALMVLTLGLLGGSDPVIGLAKDAVEELATKVTPRSFEHD